MTASDPLPHADAEPRLWMVAFAAACAIAIGLRAGFAPLSDPDFPLHLAVGEWIVANRAVPYVEPFAWTRAGEPYFAYSWTWQLTFYLLMWAAGPVGLHLLAGFLGASIVVAGVWLGRSMSLRWPPAIALGAACGVIAVESTPFLRPQLAMHLVVVLSWATMARWRNAGELRWLALLLLLAAIATNTHITAPLMFAPLALLWLDPEVTWRRRGLAAGAIVAGLLLTPYAASWWEVYHLNFRPNPMLVGGARIGELRPGFETSPFLGVALASLPLVCAPALRTARHRLLLGALWLAGLLVFARAGKGATVWWWCVLPMVALGLRQLPTVSSRGVERTLMSLLVVVLALTAIESVRYFALLGPFEGDARDRRLPSIKAFAAEGPASWLSEHLRKDFPGRVLTSFDYGSYLAWRLPALAQSVDSRTIFPDSAALPDLHASSRTPALGPWRSADLALVPLDFPVAPVLDTAAGWIRIGTASPAPWAPETASLGLWVRETWWREASTFDVTALRGQSHILWDNENARGASGPRAR